MNVYMISRNNFYSIVMVHFDPFKATTPIVCSGSSILFRGAVRKVLPQ